MRGSNGSLGLHPGLKPCNCHSGSQGDELVWVLILFQEEDLLLMAVHKEDNSLEALFVRFLSLGLSSQVLFISAEP